MDARKLVNSFCRPLGLVDCRGTNPEMWSYSKKMAIQQIDAILAELEQLHKPDYQDLHEKIDAFKKLKKEIKKL